MLREGQHLFASADAGMIRGNSRAKTLRRALSLTRE